jgi:hypothetical protein
MVEKIEVQIGLEGGDEVEKKLADIGKAGEAAFGQIEDASSKASFDKVAGEISKAGDASEKAAGQVAKVGDATDKAADSTDKLAKANASLSLETVKTSAEIAKLAAETAKTGLEIYQLTQKTEGVIKTLLSLSSNVNTTVKFIGLLTPVLGVAGVALGGTAVAAAGVAVSLAALGAAAEKLVGPYEKLNATLATLAINTGQSSEALQRGEALFKQMGVSAETFRGTAAKLAETLKDLDVGDELKKSEDSIVNANKKVLEAEKAVIENRLQGRQVFMIGDQDRLVSYLGDVERLKQITAELTDETSKAKALEDALLDARHKAAEAAANSLSKIVELVKAIEAGQKGITFDSMVKADTIIKAVAISLKQAEDNGKNAGRVLIDFIANAERAQAIEIGKKFGLKEEDVDRVRRLGGNLSTVDEVWKRIQAAGVLIPPESAKAFSDLQVEMDRVDAAKERLSQAWDSSFVARWAGEVETAVLRVETFFINLGASIVESMNSAGAGIRDMAGNTVREFTKIGELFVRASQWVGDFILSLGSITWDSIASAGVQAWDLVTGAIGNAITQASNFISTIANIAWDTIANAGVAAWNAVTGAIQGAIDKVLTLIGLKPSAPATGGGAPGKAGGGLIGGRGSGTSDSNLAWLSRGEYVVPAWAVRQPGVLAFLEMLRRIGIRALGRVGHFAAGGLVGLPHFAEGGQSDSGDGGPDLKEIIAALKRIISEVKSLSGELASTATSAIKASISALEHASSAVGGLPIPKEAPREIEEATRTFVGSANAALDKGLEVWSELMGIGATQTAQRLREHVLVPLTKAGEVVQARLFTIAERLDRLVNEVIPDAIDRIQKRIEQAVERAQEAVETVNEISGKIQNLVENAPGAASGGLIGGRGSNTSDSNLALVSRGEYIMPARAVRQPGVLALLEALRRGLDLRHLLAGIGRFAAGGPVGMPAFAGGVGGGMHPVTIQFPGMPAIDGLRASSAVVNELQRAATMAQVRSGGRKPSRYT